MIKEYIRGDSRTRESGRILWMETAQKLRKLLDQFAGLAIHDEFSRKNYFSSCKPSFFKNNCLYMYKRRKLIFWFFLQYLSKNLINV